ncbi:uncharacterized protein LOC103714217 [Phoenix dactylifera]|uniref:Uncharacterized protein LOC103714217 n=1 Tax=Phoenix dactylifera TaxID=42345 RepID=A0A8B8J853_PHODC|nr:uncharacterized protein LOC103714217 [Phoenix dactylifera]
MYNSLTDQLDIHIDCRMKSLCKNKKMDPISEYNGDTMRSLGHGTGTVQCPIFLAPARVPVANLVATPETGEKASRNKKKLEPVTRDGTALTTKDSWPLSGPPSPCPNLEIPMKSETSTSMPMSTSMTTSCMKSGDARISDSCVSVIRVSTGSTCSDSLDSFTTASIKRHTGSESR